MRAGSRVAVYACYFITGAFGLTYEIVWSRYLALLVGNTAYAHAAVLATFMGGLALGAAIFGPLADRIRDGLAAYGWLEVLVGLFGALFPAWFGICEGLADALFPHLAAGSAGLGAAKLVVAVVCILPPSILMGGTLPLLTRALTQTVDGVRSSVAGLYATNAAGAVVGGLVTGFFSLGALGLPGTVTLAGIANTLLGIAIVGVARRHPRAAPEADPPPTGAAETDPSVRRLAIGIAAFSGFATMALEVAWIRLGVLLLGSSTYAFTLMLAAFISGISGGAYLVASPAAARWRLRRAIAWGLLATALSLAVFLTLYPRLPYLTGRLLRAFAPDPEAFGLYQLAVYSVCFVAMCVPAMVAGVVLPATVRLATESGRIGARLGQVYAANTLGTLLGATLTGLLLFRWIGVEGVFRAALVAYALAAAYVGWRARSRSLLLGVLLAGAWPLLTSASDPRLTNDGTYRRHRPLTAGFEGFAASVRRADQLYFADGPHASVSVLRAGDQTTLRVNGKPDASTGADMTTQSLLGHLPMLLHPAPHDVFVLGLGSGVTAGAVLAHGEVDLTVAEISQEVVDAERHFRHVNGAPTQDPRTRLLVDDARTVLRVDATRYDVFVSEPTNPWQAGVSGLFTVEFYDLVRARLKPGGLFVQWMHVYETDDAMVSLVVATLLDRFPHVAVFEIGPSDFAFVAGERPLTLDPDAFASRVAHVAPHLARVDAERPFVLLATQVKSAATLRADFPDEPVNSDEYPVLEMRAPVAFFANQTSYGLLRSDDRVRRRGTLLVDHWLAARGLQAEDIDGLARFGRRLISDVCRRSLWRLAQRLLGPDHPTTRRAATQADAVDLRGWRHGETAAERAAWLRLAIAHYDRGFVRWAPTELTPLLTALDRLDPADRERIRGALVTAACRHESEDVCARLRRD